MRISPAPRLVSSALTLPFIVCIACSGGSFDEPSPRIEDVRVDPAAVTVGDSAEIRVAFVPAEETTADPITGEDETTTLDAIVVIRLPEGLDYVPGSSQVDTSALSGFFVRNPNSVDLCPDRSRVLVYSFEGNDLSTVATNTIIFRATAYQQAGIVFVGATAGFSFSAPCEAPLETSDSIRVG